MDGLTGESRRPTFTPLVSGLPVVGATGTYQLVGTTGQVLHPALAVAESPPGTYTPGILQGSTYWAAPGAYTERWVLAQGALTWRRDVTVLLAPWQPGLLTRRELRHRVAEECRDLTLGAATGATVYQLTDTERWEPDHHFRGYSLYIHTGVAVGLERRISDSLQSGGFLGWVTPAPTVPVAGDQYELHRRFTIGAYNRAINRALDQVRELVLLDLTDETLFPVADTWEYELPAQMTHLAGVYWRPVTGTAPAAVPTGNWRALDYGEGDYELAPRRRLRLRYPRASSQLRVIGQAAWPNLSTDDNLLAGATEYVIWRAAATLTAQRLTSGALDAEGAKDLLGYLETRSTNALVEPRSRSRPNGRRVT